MQYQDYNEHINHGTPDRPLAFYHVDERHPRYHMPMHWHIECEIIYVREGLLRLYVDDMRIAAAAGDVVFIGRGALHGGTPEDCVYECLVFDPGALLKSEPCAPFLTPLLTRSLWIRRQSESGAACTALAERLFACAQAPSDSGMLRAVGCLYEMYGLLLPLSPDMHAAQSQRVNHQRAEQLKPALEYIESHYGQHIALDTLARLAGLSPKYFCRYFRDIVHRSPIDYVNFYRVECASALLTASDMTVAEVAYQCGFNDSSFFIKQFRRYKGATPKQYRAAGGTRVNI